MKTSEEQRIDDIVGTVMAVIFAIIIASVAIGVFALFYDMGQLNGYCEAKGGKVEEQMCVKEDTVIKRGSDI